MIKLKGRPSFGSLVFCILFLAGCSNSSSIYEIDIESVGLDTIAFTTVGLEEPVYRPVRPLLQRDNSLITFLDNADGGVFKVFKYPDYKFLFRYPESGNERDKFSFIDQHTMEVVPGGIVYLDYPYLRQVSIDTINDMFNDRSYLDLSKINYEMHSVAQLNDTLFSARNDLSQHAEAQHLLFTNTTNSVVGFFGEYPELDYNFEDYDAKASFYRYRVAVNREKQSLMVFYVKLNRIRIYDFSGNLLKESSVGSFTFSPKPSEQMLYFEAPFSSAEGVYVLYFNVNHQAANADVQSLSPELHFYNWTGGLEKRWKLNAPVSGFTIDKDHRKFIGVTFVDDLPIIEGSLR